MPDIQISDIFQIRNRYLRSTHIERDFHDSSSLNSYILTPQCEMYFKTLLSGIESQSSQRAWRITGDYGTGKSSFALSLAHILSGEHKKLPENLRSLSDDKRISTLSPRYLPVLVTGSRDPINISILRSLFHSLIESHSKGKQPAVIGKIDKLIKTSKNTSVSDDEIIQLLNETNDYLRKSNKGNGILLILDEMGKFLEFAAAHPERQDVYFLQQLAEAASRSKNSPIFIVGLLHQGFNAYSEHLSHSAQREWEKVAGRFEELLFDQPLEQIALIIANALNIQIRRVPKDIIAGAEKAMSAALNAHWYGPNASKTSLLNYADRLFPLHPTVIPIMVNFFSRFGQNERSLFSFLLSNEAFSLSEFAHQPLEGNCFYRIHNFYDYIKANFGHRLSVQSYRSHWNKIESIIDSFPASDDLEIRILKTVAVLNLIDLPVYVASVDSIVQSVSEVNTIGRKDVEKAVIHLQKNKHILFYRGQSGGYCLWSNTSVNIEKAYDNALKVLGTPDRVSSLIMKDLETRPIVARRHYIKTGNLRHFEVTYASVDDLESFASVDYTTSDGRILIPLCETEEERQSALRFTRKQFLKDLPNLLIAIPSPLSGLGGLVMEYERWEWVAQNTPELNNDSYAAEEVSRQIIDAYTVLQRRIQDYVGLRQFSRNMSLIWFRQNKEVKIKSSRHLLSLISTICDEVFNKAPIIQNELINRRSPSASANGALIRLVERMFSHSNQHFLGMDPAKKPPEMSLYLSFLKKSELHRETLAGFDILDPPETDPCRLRHVLDEITMVLEHKNEDKIRVSDLFVELRKPPFGIRDGVMPLILVTYAIIHEHEVAFYKDGAFMRHLSGEDFRLIMKNPDAFEIQMCRINGVRSILFEHMLRILGIGQPSGREGDILDVVKPLMVFASKLPEYTLKTKRLSKNAMAVRDCLIKAREPVKLLFTDLPCACGFEPFCQNENSANDQDARKFATALKSAIDELKTSYQGMLDTIKNELFNAFECSGTSDKARLSIAERANGISFSVSELSLKSLCLRLADIGLPETQWLESIGSLVCSKPPEKWTDVDADGLPDKLRLLAGKFSRVESIVFTATGSSNRRALRLSITRQDGCEVEKIVYVDPNDETEIGEIKNRINKIIDKNPKLGLIAISQAIWKELS